MLVHPPVKDVHIGSREVPAQAPGEPAPLVVVLGCVGLALAHARHLKPQIHMPQACLQCITAPVSFIWNASDPDQTPEKKLAIPALLVCCSCHLAHLESHGDVLKAWLGTCSGPASGPAGPDAAGLPSMHHMPCQLCQGP